jgi:hypothetical protein
MEVRAIGRRAILKKLGSPDISIEILQTARGGFSFAANGMWGPMWPKYTPQQLMMGDTPPMTLDGAWESLLAKYPDYSLDAREDAFPASAQEI